MTDKNVNNHEEKNKLLYSKINSTLSNYIVYVLCVPGTMLGSENTIKMNKVTGEPICREGMEMQNREWPCGHSGGRRGRDELRK